jgi:hypothetical protein
VSILDVPQTQSLWALPMRPSPGIVNTYWGQSFLIPRSRRHTAILGYCCIRQASRKLGSSLGSSSESTTLHSNQVQPSKSSNKSSRIQLRIVLVNGSLSRRHPISVSRIHSSCYRGYISMPFLRGKKEQCHLVSAIRYEEKSNGCSLNQRMYSSMLWLHFASTELHSVLWFGTKVTKNLKRQFLFFQRFI